jgi:hypothetical protein
MQTSDIDVCFIPNGSYGRQIKSLSQHLIVGNRFHQVCPAKRLNQINPIGIILRRDSVQTLRSRKESLERFAFTLRHILLRRNSSSVLLV